ncbi:MAG: HAMP domain-containing histidine kinase [Synergistaceae bacterium]|nr:HAMP domain-containing histidine kinase [Synergistaceae bacterium]
MEPVKRGSSCRRLWAAAFFILFWAAAQRISSSGPLAAISLLSETMDGGDLLAAAALVVLLNSVRAVPLYIGWFLAGGGLADLRPSLSFLSWLAPAAAIPLTYFLSPVLGEGIQLHFGVPAVLSVGSVLVLRYLTRSIHDWVYKSIALAFFVFSFQWLDIIPFLTPWGAGWGELSMSVKTAAGILGRESLLDWTGGAVFGGLFFSGVLAAELMISYGARLASMALLRDREKKMAALREESLGRRSLLEMQQLVHDLKRPLTTILGLADVIVSGRGGSSARYGAVICEAARSMEDMVSEILREDFRRPITAGDLAGYVFTQISPFPWRETVSLKADPEALEAVVEVNVVRFSRALVNLLDNARKANLQSEGSHINLSLSLDGERVIVVVEDEGPGFSQEGDRSGWNSTGLGLKYVTMVVENHGATLFKENIPGGGARVTITLKRSGGGRSDA